MNETNVLIMEYEDRVNRVLCRIVKRLGLEPYPTDNYSNFKELYRKYKPRVILLSLDSPANNQGDLCRYLVDQKSSSTIILLSNMDEEKLLGFEKNGRSAGLTMGGILRKPMDMTTVQSKLEELIRPDQRNHFKKKVISVTLETTPRNRVLSLVEEMTGSNPIPCDVNVNLFITGLNRLKRNKTAIIKDQPTSASMFDLDHFTTEPKIVKYPSIFLGEIPKTFPRLSKVHG